MARILTMEERTLYWDLKKRLPDQLHLMAKREAYLRQRCRDRWGSAFDIVKMMIACSTDLSTAYVDQHRELAASKGDAKFVAIASLNGRAIRVASEVYTLLSEGFPDGALGRWRTLHEVATVALFIKNSDMDTAKRYIAHDALVAYKLAKSRSLDFDTLAALRAKRDTVAATYGFDIEKQYAWATTAVDENNPQFHHFEKALGLESWRMHFRFANREIHAGDTPFYIALGASEVDGYTTLIGRSDSGIAGPGAMLGESLSNACQAFQNEYRTLDQTKVINIIAYLRDEATPQFTKIEKETHGKSTSSFDLDDSVLI